MFELARKRNENDRKQESQNNDVDDNNENKIYENKTLPMLREICGEKGLIRGGKKADVVKRIQNHMENLRRAEPALLNMFSENFNDDNEEEGGVNQPLTQ